MILFRKYLLAAILISSFIHSLALAEGSKLTAAVEPGLYFERIAQLSEATSNVQKANQRIKLQIRSDQYGSIDEIRHDWQSNLDEWTNVSRDIDSFIGDMKLSSLSSDRAAEELGLVFIDPSTVLGSAIAQCQNLMVQGKASFGDLGFDSLLKEFELTANPHIVKLPEFGAMTQLIEQTYFEDLISLVEGRSLELHRWLLDYRIGTVSQALASQEIQCDFLNREFVIASGHPDFKTRFSNRLERLCKSELDLLQSKVNDKSYLKTNRERYFRRYKLAIKSHCEGKSPCPFEKLLPLESWQALASDKDTSFKLEMLLAHYQTKEFWIPDRDKKILRSTLSANDKLSNIFALYSSHFETLLKPKPFAGTNTIDGRGFFENTVDCSEIRKDFTTYIRLLDESTQSINLLSDLQDRNLSGELDDVSYNELFDSELAHHNQLVALSQKTYPERNYQKDQQYFLEWTPPSMNHSSSFIMEMTEFGTRKWRRSWEAQDLTQWLKRTPQRVGSKLQAELLVSVHEICVDRRPIHFVGRFADSQCSSEACLIAQPQTLLRVLP